MQGPHSKPVDTIPTTTTLNEPIPLLAAEQALTSLACTEDLSELIEEIVPSNEEPLSRLKKDYACIVEEIQTQQSRLFKHLQQYEIDVAKKAQNLEEHAEFIKYLKALVEILQVEKQALLEAINKLEPSQQQQLVASPTNLEEAPQDTIHNCTTHYKLFFEGKEELTASPQKKLKVKRGTSFSFLPYGRNLAEEFTEDGVKKPAHSTPIQKKRTHAGQQVELFSLAEASAAAPPPDPPQSTSIAADDNQPTKRTKTC